MRSEVSVDEVRVVEVRVEELVFSTVKVFLN